jgi:hypothetical protein
MLELILIEDFIFYYSRENHTRAFLECDLFLFLNEICIFIQLIIHEILDSSLVKISSLSPKIGPYTTLLLLKNSLYSSVKGFSDSSSSISEPSCSDDFESDSTDKDSDSDLSN